MTFKLQDIRESKAWQQLRAEGEEEGKITEREGAVRKCLAKGMTEKQIADLLKIGIEEVRHLANGHSH